MTFCAECKNNIIEHMPENDCCRASRLYGMLLFARSFSRDKIICASEHREVVSHFVDLVASAGLPVETVEQGKTAREYSACISSQDATERLLADFGHTGEELNLRIQKENLHCGRCLGNFVAGAFLTGGSVTNPSSGYHLEFTTYRKNLCGDFEELLRSCGFEPKLGKRGYLKTLYFKNSSTIEDILTYMDASDSSLKLMNEKILKDIVNSVNRRTNCENANIDKMVNAASADIELINKIKASGADAAMSQELREMMQLRCDNPDLPMAELGALADPPISKSGVNHRLRKIREKARLLTETE